MNNSLESHIEELRYKLYKLYETEGSFQSEEIIKISQKLDKLILLNQKEKSNIN